ncbi:MAG: sulfatase-like hydrolase/transferase [Myxococcales bacterium]|nr:sulfatase-like hydrolase/transferase [Myxococcales bacterium]
MGLLGLRSVRSAEALSTATVTTPPATPAPPAQNPARGLPRDLNVILLSIDSLRADMPWNGYPRPIAPFLTRLAGEGVVYTHAYALSSYTSMSVGGFLGGRPPSELHRDGYFFGTYPARNLFFPEVLQRAGVRTLGAHAHGYFRQHRAGFDQGFDVWHLVPNLRWDPTTDVEISGDRHAALAQRLVGDPANNRGRFFAWFHFMDPHDQYRAHPGITPYGRTRRDLYDGEVTFTDRQVEQFVTWVRAQPFGARTVFIITADHGECFGEHGHYRHGFEVWQELVRVPWIFVGPGISPRRIDQNRSHADLAPTVLQLMGAPAEPSFTGVSLVPELLGGPAPERDVVVDLPRTSNNDRRRSVIRGPWKLTAYGDDRRFELYNVETDPGEAHNLARTERARFAEMQTLYRTVSGGLRDVHPYACRTLTGAPPGRDY